MRNFIQPQHVLNAKNLKDRRKNIYIFTIKEDGHYLQGVNGEIYSKSGALLHPPLIRGDMPLHPDVIYEIEGFGKNLAETKSILGSKIVNWDKLKFLVHDTITAGEIYEDRLKYLQDTYPAYAPEIALIGTIEEAFEYAQTEVWPKGKEGLVGRLRNCKEYYAGKRNLSRIKIKQSVTFQATVIKKSTTQAVVTLITPNGKTFNCKLLTDRQQLQIKVGNTVTVEAMLINANGIPRDPWIKEFSDV